MQEKYRKEFHSGSFEGRALGDDSFIEGALVSADEVVNNKPTMEDVLAAIGFVYGLPLNELASRSRVRQDSEARAVAALTVRETEGLLLVDLGKQINQDVSSLSQSARRIALQMKEDALLVERLAAVGLQFPNCQA